MATAKVSPLSAVDQLAADLATAAGAHPAAVLDSPEVAVLVAELEATRWTGRPGYPIRSMVGMALAKSLYAIRRG